MISEKVFRALAEHEHATRYLDNPTRRKTRAALVAAIEAEVEAARKDERERYGCAEQHGRLMP